MATPYNHLADNENVNRLWVSQSDNLPEVRRWNLIRYGTFTTSFNDKAYFRDVGLHGNNGKSAVAAAVAGATGTIRNIDVGEVYMGTKSVRMKSGHSDALMYAAQGTGSFALEAETKASREVLITDFIKRWTGDGTFTGSEKGKGTKTVVTQGLLFIQSNNLKNYVARVCCVYKHV